MNGTEREATRGNGTRRSEMKLNETKRNETKRNKKTNLEKAFRDFFDFDLIIRKEIRKIFSLFFFVFNFD